MVPWERERISNAAVVLAVLSVVAGYAVPWVHMEGASAFGSASGRAKIDVFAWGYSGHPTPFFGERPRQSTALWVESLLSSLIAGRALYLLGWDPRGGYLLAGSFACYLLATMVSLFRLSGKGKKARMAIYACGFLLASLLLFLTGVEDAITSLRLHVRAFSWEAGIYVCAISFILAAFSWHHSRALPKAKEGIGNESSMVGATRNEGGSGSAQNDRSV